MSDYRKRQIGRVLDTPAPFYRLQVSADGADTKSHHLNITHAELQAIRDLLACQHGSGFYNIYAGDYGRQRVGTYCNDCDVEL